MSQDYASPAPRAPLLHTVVNSGDTDTSLDTCIDVTALCDMAIRCSSCVPQPGRTAIAFFLGLGGAHLTQNSQLRSMICSHTRGAASKGNQKANWTELAPRALCRRSLASTNLS